MSVASNFTAPVDFRLSANPPAGIADVNAQAAIEELYNSAQQIFSTLVDNCGIGPQAFSLWQLLSGSPSSILSQNMHRLYIPVTVPVVLGNALHIISNAGILSAELANATNNTKPCLAFANSAAVNPGDMIEAIVHSGIISVNGLTVGAKYFLSTTDGVISNAPATAAGNIEQYLGFAIDTTHLFFNSHYWVQH